jgi:hypothetical protein
MKIIFKNCIASAVMKANLIDALKNDTITNNNLLNCQLKNIAKYDTYWYKELTKICSEKEIKPTCEFKFEDKRSK